MEEMLVQNETLSLTERNLLAYFETHDVKYVTEDARFKNLSTGEVHTGRAEIGAMLHFIYHVAFDAKAEFKNYFFIHLLLCQRLKIGTDDMGYFWITSSGLMICH